MDGSQVLNWGSKIKTGQQYSKNPRWVLVATHGVLEQADEVRLGGLLKSADRRRLETEVGLEVLSDLTDETLEGELHGRTNIDSHSDWCVM